MLYQGDFTERERGREATTAMMHSAVRNGTELTVHPQEPFFHRRRGFAMRCPNTMNQRVKSPTGLQNINTLNSLST